MLQEDRRYRAQQRDIKSAAFHYQASMEQLYYTTDRGLDKNQLQCLATCEFIAKGEDLFIRGSTGTGKNHLASAIGHQSCLLGYKVLYANTMKLMSRLKILPISCIPYTFSLKYHLTMGEATILFNIVFILLKVILLNRNYRLIQLLQLPVVFVFGFFTDITLHLVSGIIITNYDGNPFYVYLVVWLLLLVCF